MNDQIDFNRFDFGLALYQNQAKKLQYIFTINGKIKNTSPSRKALFFIYGKTKNCYSGFSLATETDILNLKQFKVKVVEENKC